MERWIPFAAILLIILIILEPWILLVIGILLGLVFLSHQYFTKVLPPPYLSVDSNMHIQLNWIVPQGQKSIVELNPSNDKTQIISPEASAYKSLHNQFTGEYDVISVTLPQLISGDRYSYTISKIDSNGKKKHLFSGKKYWMMGPQNQFLSRPLRVAVLGDLQPKAIIPPLLQLWIMHQIRREKVDLFLYLGDHTMEGIDPILWRYFLHVIGSVTRNVPMLGVPGNHDIELKRKQKPVFGRDAYSTYMNYPEPKFQYGIHVFGLHLLMFDFHVAFDKNSEQYRFMQKELENRNTKEWLIALWHSSPYNSVKPTPDVQELRENIVPPIQAAGGKLWLGGHEHSYQRYTKDGVEFITTAATSSFHNHREYTEYQTKLIMKFHHSLMEITPDRLKFQAIALNGKKIEEFDILQS